jgi:hypothetical protein
LTPSGAFFAKKGVANATPRIREVGFQMEDLSASVSLSCCVADPLTVFDQSPLQTLGVVDVDDTGRNGEKLSQLCGAEASRSRYDLEAFRVRADGDELDEAVLPDAFGEFMKLGFFKRPARVGGGLVDGVESEELKGAAVLIDCPPWAG